MASRGRPRSVDTTPIAVRMTDELVNRIDEARAKTKGLPTRPEMIRQMIEYWLVQHEDEPTEK